ncbi:MAG: tRNA (guanosine(37)-N1)-methyltransferase TrmD [Caldilineaceae bacterium]|nr:tRNA (guanosine(37)-N1)-methyltransferase TrmD [Caldilineaceae bacterium]
MAQSNVLKYRTEDEPEKAYVQEEAPRTIHFDVFTLFPQMIAGALSESILARAQNNGILQVVLHNIRDYATDRHQTCDGYPYGGGGGMVMRPEPVVRAVESVLSRPHGWHLSQEEANSELPPWNPVEAPAIPLSTPIILLSPQGRCFDQVVAAELSSHSRLALICGRYEGVDERIRTQLITDELSIGDFVLSGGEIAALAVIDAVTRTLPGVLGHDSGAQNDSFSDGMSGLLEGPQYTRPASFRGEDTPEVLTSGHHANVERWRRQHSLLRTLERRPDLLVRAAAAGHLTQEDREFLSSLGWQAPNDSAGTDPS